MRTLFIAAFLLISAKTFAEIKPTIRNYNCVNTMMASPKSNISFDLTMTQDDLPITLGSTGEVELVKVPGFAEVGTFFITSPNTVVQDLPVSIQSEFTCEELLNCEVGFTGIIPYSTFTLVLGPNIPTLGQWALFILGLSLTSMAVVTIRKRMLAVS